MSYAALTKGTGETGNYQGKFSGPQQTLVASGNPIRNLPPGAPDGDLHYPIKLLIKPRHYKIIQRLNEKS